MGKQKKSQNKRKERKAAKRKANLRKQKHAHSERTNQLRVVTAVDDALELATEGEMGAADRILSKLRKKHPNHAYVFHGLGMLRGMNEEWDEAIMYFDRAVAISPDFLEARFNKASAYQKAMDVGNMIRSYQDVIKHGNPEDRLVLDAKEIIDSFAEHLEKDEHLTINAYLGSLDEFEKGRECMNTGDCENAILHYQKAIDINPNPPQAYGNMGICFGILGEKDKAIKAFNKALEIDPDYELAIMNKALIMRLEKGQKLDLPVKEIEYYKDYKVKSKSYIKDYLEAQTGAKE